MRICVLIPVYNESGEIGRLVSALKEKGFDVLVVDDGSRDGSGTIAENEGAALIRHEKNCGKGISLQDGFQYALKHNYEWVLTIDGDGQHEISDIQQFLDRAGECPSSVITGSRMGNPRGMPLVRLLTNRFMSSVISLVCHQRIPDTQCGFRLISSDVLREIKLTAAYFEIETEILIKASKKGFKITSVPIKTIYRNEASKINPVTDMFRFIVYMIREIWSSKT